MKKIFVSYGNERYYSSLKRLKKEAESLGIFDEVKIMTEQDLSGDILSHPLFKHKRGGGYWCWKPWIIQKTLEELEEGDIVVYSDAGCQLFPDKEWEKWWRIMETCNGIFFSYGGTMEQFSRKNLLEYFCDEYLKYYYQIQGSFFIVKKEASLIIDEWQEIMFNHPEMVIDVDEKERENENSSFIEHRHDQAVLSCIVYKNKEKCNIKVLWQRLESRYRSGQAVYAARICEGRTRPLVKFESLYIILIKFILISPYRRMRMKILTILTRMQGTGY